MINFYAERIQRGVDFVESHLDEEVPLHAVARAAGLSQWHFQRIFKSITGETLKAYIRGRRLANSLGHLAATKLRVLDVALLAGFESQEAFARAFKGAFGITPMAYRKLGRHSLLLKKLRLDGDMLQHVLVNVSLQPSLHHQPAMTLVGCRTRFYGPDSERNNVGEQLPPLWAAFLARRFEIESGRREVCYGVVRQEREDGDELEYFAAVQVDSVANVPAGMAVVEIPAAIYAEFEHRGPAEVVDRTVSYVYSTWLLQSGCRHTGGPDLEIYDDRFHPTAESSVFRYAIPVLDLRVHG